MNWEKLARTVWTEARSLWWFARLRPKQTVAITMAVTVAAATVTAIVVTLVVDPLRVFTVAYSTVATLILFGALTWVLVYVFVVVGGAVTRYFFVLLPRQTRVQLAATISRWAPLIAMVAAQLGLLWIVSALTVILVIIALVVAAIVSRKSRRHAQTLAWLTGHLAGAAREFDPSTGEWQIRADTWDRNRLTYAEVYYPAALRVSEARARATVERAVLWAMRHEQHVYGLRWSGTARRVDIIAEPPLPERFDDAVWPRMQPGIPVGVCALMHADATINDGGKQVGVRCWNPDAQRDLLIVGVKGSGKTILARGLIVRAIKAGWFPAGVMILDGKSSADYATLEGREGILVVARKPEQWLAALQHLVSIMEERYEADYRYETGQAPNPNLDRMAIVLDEIQNIRAELGKDADEALSKLARMARGGMITLIVVTQRPDTADAIPGAIRDQLEDRIAVGWLSENGARMALEDDWRIVVDEQDPTGEKATVSKPRGRAVARIAGRVSRIQIPWLDSPVRDPRVEQLYPPREATAPLTPPVPRTAEHDESALAAGEAPPIERAQRRGRKLD